MTWLDNRKGHLLLQLQIPAYCRATWLGYPIAGTGCQQEGGKRKPTWKLELGDPGFLSPHLQRCQTLGEREGGGGNGKDHAKGWLFSLFSLTFSSSPNVSTPVLVASITEAMKSHRPKAGREGGGEIAETSNHWHWGENTMEKTDGGDGNFCCDLYF